MPRAAISLVAAASAVLALAACAPAKDKPAAKASASSCTPDKLQTLSKGTLTVATDNPAYPPWYVDDKPANGKGFESAVAYAVGKQLGYPADKVKWTVATFDSIVQLGPKKFDFDANEVSITPDRKKAVDFSSGYYDVTQAIIALKTSKIAKAGSIADLQSAKLGAQIGTTSYDTITDTIKPSKKPAVYNTNDIAKQMLKNGQLDGLVVDLPTAFEMESEISGTTIVGQVPSTGKAEQFGLVLGKDSSLTSCVSKAVDTLRKNGTLSKLQKQWLATDAGAPVLQ
ncbi:MAG TPA: ABC transporter substrate-binding protein [Mycobacteriales bacterium]|jgi:polar amino acid transport system substrate-binding protein|nr:ABC transporter substrate-binding protein [Mycobacteriales bacterium]